MATQQHQQQRYRSASSGPGEEESQSSSKSLKTHHGQSAPPTRVRRAARACDRCRASKLRCQAPDSSSSEKRCAHCVRTDVDCKYTNPLPPQAASSLNRAASRAPDAPDGNERLSKLEANVVKLLEIMEKKTTPPLPAESTSAAVGRHGESWHESSGGPSVQRPAMASYPSTQTCTLEELSHLATHDSAPAASSGDFDAWLSPSIETTTAPRDPGFGNLFDTLVTAATDHAEMPLPSPQPPAVMHHRLSSTTTAASVSPVNSVETKRTPASVHDSHHPSSGGAAQARPIPKAGAGSRMAAFTEPLSHEAPFRPLAYNPDTFRNTEMVDEGNGELSIVGGGQSTPKRGRGDPIDRGIFQEDEARSLFAFFKEQIAFFMPIFQEPMTFDHIRHQSSFLLSTILAVAAKYTCITTTPPGGASAYSGSNPFGESPLVERHPKPVSEDKWEEIRALATSSYFQALISKVHCLEDVQAILLQCAWGLQDRGGSPDPWMMTGSAYRLARRLGIHLAAESLMSGSAQPTARAVASLKTYLCLYAFDRFFTVGFGRPETEGYAEATIDTSMLLSLLHSDHTASSWDMFCSPESAACVAAYVELANTARQYSRFVNVTLKAVPESFLGEMREISGRLEAFSSRWLWARSPLSAKLGPSQRPIKMLYNHMRLCLHTVPLKPTSHPDSERFLQRTRLQGAAGSDFLSKCLKKAEDCAAGIIQDFADDSRDDNDTVLCYGYDYAFMILAHSAAILLSMATISVCGITTAPVVPETSSTTRGRQVVARMDRTSAKRYYEMAITALVDSNRSANFFPCDMACNLGLIAHEMGISVAEWMSDGQTCRVGRQDQCACSYRPTDRDSAVDYGFLFDIDQFLQPGILEDGSLFSSTLLM